MDNNPSKQGVMRYRQAINCLATAGTTTAFFTTAHPPPTLLSYFIIESIDFVVESLTGTITDTSYPVISVGSNSTAYNNVVNGENAALTALHTSFRVIKSGLAAAIAANVPFFIRLDTAAVGPTVMTVEVIISGYYATTAIRANA